MPFVTIAGVDIELHDSGGDAPPLLLLHSGQGFIAEQPYVGMLARQRRLIAPSHPGFGKSALPDWIDHVDDIAHLYLELMDRLGLAAADIVGCSIGGWIAAELASKTPERVKKLVMVGAVGVKTGPIDKLDVADIFAVSPDEQLKLLFHDPAKFKPDPSKMTDEQLSIMVRNRETLALLAWEPYMHNPKLKHRLHRVTAPALFLRGAADGVVSAEYTERYARLLPNARTATIAAAGHAPQVEQPEAFASAVFAFLNG
jgi:pimeloyl-ACP methyl ester carboxylesterase